MEYKGRMGNNLSLCGVIERVILRGVLAKNTRLSKGVRRKGKR